MALSNLTPNYYLVFKLNMFFLIVLCFLALGSLLVQNTKFKNLEYRLNRMDFKIDHALESASQKAAENFIDERFGAPSDE